MALALRNDYESYANELRKLQKTTTKNNNNYNNDYVLKLEKKKVMIKEYITRKDNLRSTTKNTTKEVSYTVNLTKEKYTIATAAELLGVTVRTLENWEKAGKIAIVRDTKKRRFIAAETILSVANCENEERSETTNEVNETYEPVDNQEVYEVEKISPPAPVPVYDISRNIKDEVMSEVKHVVEQQQKYFSDIIAKLQEDNTRLVNELREKQEKDAEHLRGRVSRIDEFIEEYRREQKRGVWAKIKALFRA